jgi:hypothetical protein
MGGAGTRGRIFIGRGLLAGFPESSEATRFTLGHSLALERAVAGVPHLPRRMAA